MFTRNIFLLLVFVLFSVISGYSQKGVTTVGLQLKPIFPATFLGTGIKSNIVSDIRFDTELNSGLCAGMLIRHGFTDLLAVETGISFVKRTFHLSITDGNFSGSSSFRSVGYEIPVSLLVYIRLGEQLFMNASMGSSIDIFASSVQSHDDYFKQLSVRKSLIQAALLTNLGWEWRTEKSGFIYVGASYHRPFSYIYNTKIKYDYNGKLVYSEDTHLLGDYLTLDLRYFFPENKTKSRNEGSEE